MVTLKLKHTLNSLTQVYEADQQTALTNPRAGFFALILSLLTLAAPNRRTLNFSVGFPLNFTFRVFLITVILIEYNDLMFLAIKI